jgi:hypothetical protein
MEFSLETEKLIFLTGANSSIIDGEPAGNSFAEFLANKGLLVSSPSRHARRLVCIDYLAIAGTEIRRLGLRVEDCTLVRMEPSVILPDNFSSSRTKQFGKVITVGGTSSSQSICVNWPLLWPKSEDIQSITPDERQDRIVVVNGNKISFVRGELYSLRREAIRDLSNLDLYGTDWSSSFCVRLITAVRSLAHAVLSLKLPSIFNFSLWFRNYSNYKGQVQDKIGTMSKYRYALVIENSAEYMSEKLMEALFAGCIPIYVGPDPMGFGIPRDLVVCAEPTLGSIRESFNQAASWDLAEFQSRLKRFLSFNETRTLWDHKVVYGKILEEIQRIS